MSTVKATFTTEKSLIIKIMGYERDDLSWGELYGEIKKSFLSFKEFTAADDKAKRLSLIAAELLNVVRDIVSCTPFGDYPEQLYRKIRCALMFTFKHLYLDGYYLDDSDARKAVSEYLYKRYSEKWWGE